MATVVLAHGLLERKRAFQASAAVAFWASCIAISSMLDATKLALTAVFWFAQVEFGGVLVSMLVSWQQTTRMLSIAGLTCMPLTHPPVDWAKSLSNLRALSPIAPAAPAAAVLRKSRRFGGGFAGIVASFPSRTEYTIAIDAWWARMGSARRASG